MGIKQLIPHLQKTVPDLFVDLCTPNVAHHLANKRIAIDATLLMFRFWHAYPTAARTADMQPHPCDDALHRKHLVQCFYNLFEFCRYIHAQPILVFDHGSRPVPKQEFIHVVRNKNKDRQEKLQSSALYIHDQLDTCLKQMRQNAVLESDPAHDLTSSPMPENEIRDLFTSSKTQMSESDIDVNASKTKAGHKSDPVRDIGIDISSKIQPSGGFIDWLTPMIRKFTDLNPFKALESQLLPSSNAQPELKQTSASQSSIAKTDTPTDVNKILQMHSENLMNPRTNLHQIGKPLLALSEKGVLSSQTSDFATLSSIRDQMETESLRLNRSLKRPPPDIVSIIAQLSRFCDVPVLLTPNNSEAEQVCGALVALGEADAVASDDSDTLIFYPQVQVIKDFFKFHTRPYLFGPISSVPDRLGLADKSHSALIDLCILSGCDYSSKIPFIGISRALALLKQYKSIETVLANRSDLRERVKHDAQWQPQKARAVFQNKFLDTSHVMQLAKHAALLVNDKSMMDTRFNNFDNSSKFLPANLDQFQIEPFDAYAYDQLLRSLDTKQNKKLV